MPSKKKVTQKSSRIAQLCTESKMQISGDAPSSHRLIEQEKLHAQPNSPAETRQQTYLVPRRSSSQKSISTDEGSSSSGLSSEVSASSPLLCASSSSRPASQEFSCLSQTAANLPVQICIPHAPLWVGNGLTGDEAAWLLVLPKFQQRCDHAEHDKAHMPKSPNDAVILGPYVTTKNTFLDEARVGGNIRQPQRSRTQSLGALR